jgi:hypothetical protein
LAEPKKYVKIEDIIGGRACGLAEFAPRCEAGNFSLKTLAIRREF